MSSPHTIHVWLIARFGHPRVSQEAVGIQGYFVPLKPESKPIFAPNDSGSCRHRDYRSFDYLVSLFFQHEHLICLGLQLGSHQLGRCVDVPSRTVALPRYIICKCGVRPLGLRSRCHQLFHLLRVQRGSQKALWSSGESRDLQDGLELFSLGLQFQFESEKDKRKNVVVEVTTVEDG